MVMMTMMILLCDGGCEAPYARYRSGLSQNPAREVYRPHQTDQETEAQKVGEAASTGPELLGRHLPLAVLCRQQRSQGLVSGP